MRKASEEAEKNNPSITCIYENYEEYFSQREHLSSRNPSTAEDWNQAQAVYMMKLCIDTKDPPHERSSPVLLKVIKKTCSLL